jgi:hypothetical protein
MKRIIVISLIGAVLFGACKKDDNSTGNYAVSPAANNTLTQSGKDIPQSALLVYSLAANLPASNGVVQWNSGNINIGEITFDGYGPLGNEMIHEHDRIVVNKNINLLPVSAAGNVTQLGNVSVPFGSYNEAIFGTLLTAILPPSNPVTNQPMALYLSGTFLLNGRNVPVILMISEATGLTATLTNPINLVVSLQDYNVMLALNLDQALAGLNANTLGAAALVNNSILISANANQNLYQMILNNLGNSLKVTFDGSSVTPNPSNNVPVSAPFPAH